MNQEITILSSTLKASSRGKPVEAPYRAVLIRNREGLLVVQIQQEIKGDIHPCCQWHLSTLLFGWPENIDSRPGDGLSIDHGQQWQIDAGMLEALSNAIEFI